MLDEATSRSIYYTISEEPSENKVMELIQGDDRSKWMVQSNHSIKTFTKGDIERITNNFKTVIGKGGFGEVFEGVLEDQNRVAVKKFINNVKENFNKELTIHREINHRNVVKLIGYCIEENALTMVTEYVPNGNLSEVLHSDNTPISLDKRLMIATECAEALAYMHSYMYTRVIHGDIKPANILLDGNFHAKITDFGISRLVNTNEVLHTENVIGSIGYMDPLFARDGCLTVKSDVYSFGVVLLEMITRKRVTTKNKDVSIVSLFSDALVKGIRGVKVMFDSEIANKNNLKILEGVAKLAGECLMMERGGRPEMVDVAERLRTLMKASQKGQQRVGFFSWTRKSKLLSSHQDLTELLGHNVSDVNETKKLHIQNTIESQVAINTGINETHEPQNEELNITNAVTSGCGKSSHSNDIASQHKVCNAACSHETELLNQRAGISSVEIPESRRRPEANSVNSDAKSTQNGNDDFKPRGTISLPIPSDRDKFEWVEQCEPGVYITLCTLQDGTRDLKKVRFSRRRFREEHEAEIWWNENRGKVYEEYNVKSEWIEQCEPGVYITLCTLQDGTRDLKKVRFSRRLFGEGQAENWWNENRQNVYNKYNLKICEPVSTAAPTQPAD